MDEDYTYSALSPDPFNHVYAYIYSYLIYYIDWSCFGGRKNNKKNKVLKPSWKPSAQKMRRERDFSSYGYGIIWIVMGIYHFKRITILFTIIGVRDIDKSVCAGWTAEKDVPGVERSPKSWLQIPMAAAVWLIRN